MENLIEIYTDGATVGHNGKLGTVKEVGLGVWIPSTNRWIGKRCEGKSNNEAEFKALIHAMEYALENGMRQVRFNLDSKIVVDRAVGKRPKDPKFFNERMDAFQDIVREMAQRFEFVSFRWIPREQNKKADEISKLYAS